MTGQAKLGRELSDAVKRKAPKVTLKDHRVGGVEMEEEHQLRDLYGLKTSPASHGICTSALNALGENAAPYADLMLSMAEEMEPRDAFEAMLVSQMTATHIGITMLTRRMVDAANPDLREAYERSMTRLSRTFIAQMDAFKKYRAKAQQTVRVERVTVEGGGQAIVGSVSHGGRSDDEK